jgi:protein-tyrosine phosphatase
MVIQENLAHCIHTDSAGTHAYHVGEAPDRRAQATAAQHGVDISNLRARRVAITDFSQFHYVLAMDQDNLTLLLDACPANYQDRVRLFLDFAPTTPPKEVPDPYYGGQAGFEHVYELVTAASRGLLADIRQRISCE